MGGSRGRSNVGARERGVAGAGLGRGATIGVGRGRRAALGAGLGPLGQDAAGLGSQEAAGIDSQATLPAGQNTKKKAQDSGDSIEWTDANTELICSLFAKQVNKGNRPNTHLNSVGYDEETDSDSDDSTDESEHFWNLVVGAIEIAQIYADLYLAKNPTRTSQLSGTGWLLETMRTPGECHTQLRMCNEIFLDIHGVLVNSLELCMTQVFCIMHLKWRKNFFRILQEVNTMLWMRDILIDLVTLLLTREKGIIYQNGIEWPILFKMPPYLMYKQKMIVVAVMVLHHLICEHGGDEDFARFDRDPDFIPTIPERYNKYAVSHTASDGSTSATNAPTMNVFGDDLVTALSLACTRL